jgi:hypothetical protein
MLTEIKLAGTAKASRSRQSCSVTTRCFPNGLSRRCGKKRTRGTLTGHRIPLEARGEVVDFARVWSDKTEAPNSRMLGRIGVGASKVLAVRNLVTMAAAAQQPPGFRASPTSGSEPPAAPLLHGSTSANLLPIVATRSVATPRLLI